MKTSRDQTRHKGRTCFRPTPKLGGIWATIHETASDAIIEGIAGGCEAILYRGECLTVNADAIKKLQDVGAEFAYLCDHEGEILTIPVN